MISPAKDLSEQLEILERLDLPENARVLEAGCATAPLLLALAKKRPSWRLTGIDLCCGSLSEACMAAAKQKSGIDFIQLDLYNMPYADETFDLVYTRDVLAHLFDREQALCELKRVLKKNGVLMLFEQL
jgi:ubiquinone/menaquinone biosynthesis C-methylase UbiE